MSNQSGSSRFRVLFETALQDYDRQTGTTWANHHLAEQLGECNSVESISALLQEQARSFSDSRGGASRIMKPLKRTVSVLYTLSSSLGEAIGMVHPKLLVSVPSL
jgi:Lon protease-like protein